jgi:hypothetical protein
MFEWLNANIAYWHWLIFGLCLALAEIMLLSFVTLWFGLAAIVNSRTITRSPTSTVSVQINCHSSLPRMGAGKRKVPRPSWTELYGNALIVSAK